MPAAGTFAAPSSRNAPCPCGSGRRYKECHGAIGGAAPSLDAMLRDALAAQQAGRLADAIAGYEQALAVAPAHFDALHMLGVAYYQRGEFEQALALIDRALTVQPGFPTAVFNRQLVQHGLTMRAAHGEGMHESTVSRVTSNKYVATPRGIFEMKYFFTASISATRGGEAHSAEAVRFRIKQMIDGETPDDVLSDDAIVQKLRETGIDIARRTVAKYREGLKIPSSVERRREKQAMASSNASRG